MSELIYLSGPITGIPFFKAMFGEFEDVFSRQGFIVVNPAKNPDGLSYDYYMELSMIHVRRCKHIALLPYWDSSKGALAEVEYATCLGKVIWYPELLIAEDNKWMPLYGYWEEKIKAIQL